ncbi:hypothetical protein HY504_01570 [Candidatus Wolfebacteria bacterium]|nr:hypothetical protein [Candidatus Wolfebacteria bacterium]
MVTATRREQIFDVGKAREVWPAAEFWQNPSYPYCRFVFRTPENGLRLEVGIDYYPGNAVALALHLATLSCDDIYSGPPRHAVPVGLYVWNIEEVRYDRKNGRIEFLQDPVMDGNRGDRSIIVCADGLLFGGIH